MKEFKKKLAVILAFCMVLTSTVPAFAATIQEGAETSAQTEDNALLENDEYEEASHSNAKYEDNILTDEEDIEEVIIEENFEDVALIDDTEEVLPAEDEEAEFFAEVKVGNVIITAKAEAGVVPKGTILKAKKVVDKEVKEAIDEVVEEKREDEAQVVESLKFDIKLLKDGEEIEPDGLVSLSFALADAVANAEANIYHIIEDEETKELVEAEVLDVETVEEPEDEATLVLETEVPGFSYYVVEFTVGELQYVLEGDSSVKLSEILAGLKIEGTVTEAVSGAPELFSVEKDAAGDDWTVTALKAFSTEEWMRVTVDGKEYTIIVTDEEKITVADVLAKAIVELPTDPESSDWKKGNDYKMFISNGEVKVKHLSNVRGMIFIDTKVSLNDELNYEFEDPITGAKGLLNMSGAKLVSINITHEINPDYVDYEGIYEPPTYTVTFDTQGAVPILPQIVMNGEKATKPANPAKPGCEFAGWYTDVSCADGTEYNFNTPVTKDITLYAKWVVVPRATITGLTADKPVYKVGDTIKLTATIDGADGTKVYFVVSGETYIVESNNGEAFIAIPLPFTNPGDYTITASLLNGSNKIITITVKQGSTPDPKKKESSSGTYSVFTGTTGNPVTNGKWTQNADGTWSYATTSKFANTWGCIANPNDAGSAAWYYFDRNGNMLTGWQKLYWNGAYRWYYFSQTKDSNEGKCQLGGITPDGWTVDESGAWVESIPKK